MDFGGSWTEDKLNRVRKYLVAYMTIMKDKRFTVTYIGAFAGTGYVERNRHKAAAHGFFKDLAGPEAQSFLEGSTRQALRVDPPFDHYVFIEKSAKRAYQLEMLKDEFPHLRNRILIRKRDANEYLIDRCKHVNWSKRRAVLFLDPFGMEVSWQTVEAIGRTKAIDMWYMFPLGIAVSRLLVQGGEIPKGWRQSLDRIFGESGWYDVFYRTARRPGFFDLGETTTKIANFKVIADYFVGRLRTAFSEGQVAPKPLRLCNSSNNPLYLLCFAAGNPRGAPTAVRSPSIS